MPLALDFPMFFLFQRAPDLATRCGSREYPNLRFGLWEPRQGHPKQGTDSGKQLSASPQHTVEAIAGRLEAIAIRFVRICSLDATPFVTNSKHCYY